jgi:glycosyltransferase involved in cell wall biosynthesis
MRIGIDGRSMGKRVGMGVYSLSLLKALVALGEGSDFLVYLSKGSKVAVNGSLVKKSAWGPLDSHTFGDFWEHFVLPLELRNECVQVYHGTNGRLPLRRSSARYAVTIHDLTPIVFPEFYTSKYSYYASKATRISARSADIIITPSESTKRDVVGMLGTSPDRVRVTDEGVSERFTVMDESECLSSLSRNYGIRPGFILFVGRLERKKNIKALISSLRTLVDRGEFGSQLVLVGAKTWIHPEIEEWVRENRVEDNTVFVHDAGHEELPVFYNGASVFAFPSLHEGFGLPVLEAMACGTPVVTSNVSSMPEVAGDAAILVDPRDPESIADGLNVALHDSERREELIGKGLARVKQYTWEATARKTYQVYRECVGLS